MLLIQIKYVSTKNNNNNNNNNKKKKKTKKKKKNKNKNNKQKIQPAKGAFSTTPELHRIHAILSF